MGTFPGLVGVRWMFSGCFICDKCSYHNHSGPFPAVFVALLGDRGGLAALCGGGLAPVGVGVVPGALGGWPGGGGGGKSSPPRSFVSQ